ncbi:hypothetical protein [Flavobacterium sp. W22_SRS_FP1]|uniref:hypothetical protein n=1 Tax=Flavobacterium sp. W22_SRS_FP1 TaxID=3240276 RepID=UPI003F91A31A
MNRGGRAVDLISVQDFNGNPIDLAKEYQRKPILDILYNNEFRMYWTSDSFYISITERKCRCKSR